MAPPTGESAPRRIAQTTNSGEIATLLLSPSANVNITGTQPGAPGSTSIFVWQGNNEIKLTGVDIFGKPEIGDGKNQFAYDGTVDGQLQIPARASVAGGVSEDQEFVRPAINWTITPLIAGQTNLTILSDATSIFPRSQYFAGGFSTEVDTLVFKGLPAINGDFGNRTLNLTVNGNPSTRAAIQNFFTATAGNHPSYPTNQVPNWYFYYNQLYTAPGDYVSTRNSYTETTPPYRIRIGIEAYQSNVVRVMWIDPAFSQIRHLGNLGLKGFHCYLFSCGHESAHKMFLTNGIDIPGRPRGLILDPNGDWDQDGLGNQWELDHFLDPYVDDTTLSYGFGGDHEVIADIEALGEVLPRKSQWTQDWANTGLLWGAWGRNNESTCAAYGLLTAAFPFHPWYYDPVDNALPFSQDPPAEALTAVP